MADLRTSARRILAAYGHGHADRIPIRTPMSWGCTSDIDREKPGGWRADPEFIRVARLVQQHCDPTPPFNPVGYPRVFAPYGYQRFLEAPDEYVEKLPDEKLSAVRTQTKYVLHTPKGDLFWSYARDEGIETAWDTRRPIEKPEDVEKLLSVPYRFDRPDPAKFEPYRQHRRDLGPDCIGGGHVCSMVAMLCGVMEFELLLEWVISEPALIKLLADTWLKRVREKVEFMLDQGVGPFWHFNGVERASPPMMGPRQWEQLVVPYDGAIMKLIKSRDPQAKIHVHCHGKVATLFKSWLELGVDSTDPVEPPPQGDIEFAEAKRVVDGRMTLFGNIEFCDMEMCTPDQIEEKVRRAILDGGKQRLVLYPSAGPHERHTPQFLANAVRYIEAGLKYGTLP